MTARRKFTVTPLSPILGSTVADLNVADLLGPEGAELVAEIRALLHERLVLLFPRQRLTPQDYVAFAALYGELPTQRYAQHVPGEDRIKFVSNGRDAEGKPIGAGNAAELVWHADDTYRSEPPSFMYLHAIKVPDTKRPSTSWLSMYEIHDRLDPDMLAGLEGLHAHHAAIGTNDVRHHRHSPPPSIEAGREGARHPLVRAHPDSGRPAVFMPRRRDALVVDRTPEESASIIEPLWDIVTASDHGCSVTLTVGDLVVWDNRFTLHAREAWSDGDERTLWRLANLGEQPIPFPQDSALDARNHRLAGIAQPG